MLKQFLFIAFFFLLHLGLRAQDLETIGKEKPIRFNGGLALGANFYHVEGIEPRLLRGSIVRRNQIRVPPLERRAKFVCGLLFLGG
jgi:hypothetical protein